VDELTLVRRTDVEPVAVAPDAALAVVALAVRRLADGD